MTNLHAPRSQRGTETARQRTALPVLDTVNLFDVDGLASLGRAANRMTPTSQRRRSA
ncbi:hypothetical protein [Pseudoxanthomonas sp.]|uniref:hypothetical protein n=1 Tax=Pseudoxanthomonas sp. TaxID=1871049 RepID=UPI002E109DE3|nr:hypothetical protein [Pseudoxanthomonas sp.]